MRLCFLSNILTEFHVPLSPSEECIFVNEHAYVQVKHAQCLILAGYILACLNVSEFPLKLEIGYFSPRLFQNVVGIAGHSREWPEVTKFI